MFRQLLPNKNKNATVPNSAKMPTLAVQSWDLNMAGLHK
jgi:hypothetical protein